MSDRYTEVRTASGHGLGMWGHVSHAEAVAQIREHYECERQAADEALAEIAAGKVTVYQQLGPYAARNRREVQPDISEATS